MKLEPVTTPTAFISLSVIVSDPVPIVRIPVTLALPSTIRAVVAVPVFTTTPLLKVLKPTTDKPAPT